MDNRQSKPTGQAPSQGRVWYDLAWFVIAAAVTAWIAWGAETGRELAGAGLGVLLALLLGLQAFAALVQLHTHRLKVRREALERALADQGYTVTQYKPGPY